MKQDQIAYLCSTPSAEALVKKALGLEKAVWIEDVVKARSIIYGQPHINIARLQFNYDLGIELEILDYRNTASWHDPFIAPEPFISHVGFHLDDGEEFPAMEGCPLVQETFTLEHTAPYLTNTDSPGYRRKYHYRIHKMGLSYVKFIRRIHFQK